MALAVHPGEAAGEDADPETVPQEVLRGVSDTVFRGDAGHIDFLGFQQMEHFGEGLAGLAPTLEAAVLLPSGGPRDDGPG